METPTKLLLPSQTTIRFADDERSFINENLNKLIASFDKPESEITRNELMVKAFTEAIANKTAKVEYKDTEETTAKLTEVTELNTNLTETNRQLTLQVEELSSKLDASNANQLPAGAIVLNLEPTERMYFWGINQLCKKSGFSNNYEELLQKMFEVFKARGEFVIDVKDAEYLNTLNYDGKGTTATSTE